MLSGIDGLLLVVVIGDGKLVVPVDFAIRRPTPSGGGGPCWDNLNWARTMIDDRLKALSKRGLNLPPPIITGDSWFSDSKLRGHIRQQHQGTLLVEGKVSYTFTLADGRHVNGHDFLEGEWPWRDDPWAPGVRHVRLQAKSPTYGLVTVVIVDEPGVDRFYLLCLETTFVLWSFPGSLEIYNPMISEQIGHTHTGPVGSVGTNGLRSKSHSIDA